MPDLKIHEEDSLKNYGKKFTELHQWMDEPVKIMGRQHRKYRHDPNITPIEALRMFGKNADNACLDHIILDTDDYLNYKKEKINNSKKTEYTQQVSIRIPKEIMKLISEWTKNSSKNNLTDTILFFLRRGIITEHTLLMVEKFSKEQEQCMMGAIKNGRKVGTNLMIRALERDDYTCRKCGSKKDVFQIDLPLGLEERTFAGLGAENSITLCKECLHNMTFYVPRRYGMERFIEWYYGE
jgi:hypothetical protein